MTLTVANVPSARRAYDHRLREHAVRCGAKTVARHVHISRSTISTWRRRGLRSVVSAEPVGHSLQQALDSSARREKRARVLAAVVRLLFALLRASGFSLDENRLPQGKAKAGLLRAITSAQAFLPLATILHLIGVEPGRCHAWRRAEKACDLRGAATAARRR
jgi:hypothetical protein